MTTRSRRIALLVALLVGVFAAGPAQSLPVPASSSAAVAAHHPDYVLVAFAPGIAASDRAAVHAQQRGRVENTLEWLNLDVVRLPKGDTPTAASDRYERNPAVAYAHPNWEMSVVRTPNDPLFGDEWGLHNSGQLVTGSFVKGTADKDVDAPEGFDLAFGNAAIPASGGERVGILDTGIDQAHIDLLGKTLACASALTAKGTVINGACADDNLHGTHVAGTVAAIADNSAGVAGVAPNADLAIFKALNSAGVGFYADIIAGIHWLGKSDGGAARIISMSIGGEKDDALEEQLTKSWNEGILLIAAAGNDGDATESYPAYHRDVVSVAAIDAAGKLAWFSTCNRDVEVAAPGEDVWSTVPGNGYALLSGTSMATPHVSGVASMVWTATPGLSNSQVRQTITTKTEGDGGCNGVGVLNLAAALGGSGTIEPAPTEPADPGAIAGAVSEQRTKQPIGGALVDCGVGGSATTASDGRYAIDGVDPGTYECTASASGYHSKSASVTVSSATTTNADFTLRRTR